MDYTIIIFLVHLTVYRQKKKKNKDCKEWGWIVLEVVQNIKTLEKPVVEFEFGIIKDRWISAYLYKLFFLVGLFGTIFTVSFVVVRGDNYE